MSLPPSLRAFLLVSNGWWRVAGWIDSLHPCADIEWFTDRFGEEWLDEDSDGSDDVFRYGLVIAQGETSFCWTPATCWRTASTGRISLR